MENFEEKTKNINKNSQLISSLLKSEKKENYEERIMKNQQQK